MDFAGGSGWSPRRINGTDSEEAVTPTNPAQHCVSRRPLPRRRGTSRPEAARGVRRVVPAGLDRSRGRRSDRARRTAREAKKGKVGGGGVKEAPQPSLKKQPRRLARRRDAPARERRTGRRVRGPRGPRRLRDDAGRRPLGAVEAAGLRAHAQQLESENARLRRDGARAGRLEVGGPAAVSPRARRRSPRARRGGSRQGAQRLGHRRRREGGVGDGGGGGGGGGTSPAPGPRPRRVARGAPRPPARVPSRLRTAPAPPPPPGRPPGVPRPGTTRLERRSRISGQDGDRRRGRRRPRAELVVASRGPRRGCPRLRRVRPGGVELLRRPRHHPPVPAGPPPPGMQAPNAKMGSPPAGASPT